MQKMKNNVLCVGFVALTAFSYCGAMQKEDKRLDSTKFQSIDKKRTALLVMTLAASILPESIQAHRVLGIEHDVEGPAYYLSGSVYHATETSERGLNLCKSGKALCTRYRKIFKRDENSWILPPGYFYEEKEWHCTCINPTQEKKEKKAIQLPKMKKYDNATCPALQKVPSQKRNGARGKQSGKR